MKIQLTFALAVMALAVAATGCHMSKMGGGPGMHNLPPAERLMHPGPGVAGPGPGVLPPYPGAGASPASYEGGFAGGGYPGDGGFHGGCVDGGCGPNGGYVDGGFVDGYGMDGGGMSTLPLNGVASRAGETQVLFAKPEGMQVRWDTGGAYNETPLIVPGRYNFQQGAIYRLKLTNIPNREGVELYPTLEIGPSTPRTEAFLAHNALPVQFTPEDFDQVLSGNFVTKVIYLPDPEFQELALAGVETLVSTRLEPGTDPIVEADRRGSIIGIIRLGNIDPELPTADAGEVIIDGGAEFIPEGDVVPDQLDLPPAAYRGGAANIRPVAYGSATGGHYGMAAYPSAQVSPGMAPYSAGIPPAHVAGVSTPSWGMPITGTPIGLPGPAHLPLGHPAGLQRHSMLNHTKHQLPEPTRRLQFDVKHRPGFSYPAQPHRAWVDTQMSHPAPHLHQPKDDKHHFLP